VNPLKLSKAVTIKGLKASIGILYASAPSSVTLGGGVVVGSISGSVLIHTGVDPRQQLLQVKLRNLDAVALLNAIGGLMGVQLAKIGGSDAFFVRKLNVYLSTGVEIMGAFYPKGILLDADMTIFGKRATLYAEIQPGLVVMKGSVEKFKLGPLEVCAASSPDKDPSMDIELSSFTQRIKIDGKVIFGQDNWVMILVDIDTGKGTFYAHFELVVGDALIILAEVKLEGGLPPTKQDRVDEIEDAKSGKVPSLPQLQPQPPSNPKPPTDGGLLQGKTFTVHARVKQDIVVYLVKLANDHLGGERNPGELANIARLFDAAEAALREAERRYKTVETESTAAVVKIAAGLDQRATDIRNQVEVKQTHMDTEIANLDKQERNLVMQSAQDERDLAEREAREAAKAKAEARQVHTSFEAWSGRVQALRATDAAEQRATTARDAAELELADAQAAMVRHERTRPKDDGTDPAFEPWRWEHQVLKMQADSLEVRVAEAASNAHAAKDGLAALAIGTVEEAEAKLAQLASDATEVDDAAADRLAAVADNIDAGKAAARKTRENLQKRRVALRAHAQKTIEGLRVQETAFERERAEQLAAARAKNDPLKTGAGEAYETAVQTHRSADVKLRAYRHLKDCISGADAALLTPLRFAVNVMGKGLNELLNVKSIVLDGSLSDTNGRVKAAVSCTVGGYDWDWSLEIDLGDIVSFFNRLWEKIKSVIASVADKLLDVAKKGVQAVKELCKEIGTEVRKIADDARRTADEFLKDLARVQDQVEGFLDDIDRKVLQPFIKAAETIARGAVDVIKRVDEALDRTAVNISRDLDSIHNQAKGVARDIVRDVDRSVSNFVRNLGSAFIARGQRRTMTTWIEVARPVLSEEDIKRLWEGMQRESDEIEESRRQNWETRPAGEERDDVEMEPAMRKEGTPPEGEMKRVAIDVEIEELRDRLMKGKSEMEEMLARGEEPEKIQKVVEYLERIMVALERRTDELRALGDDTEEPAEE